jgi:MFS family permease
MAAPAAGHLSDLAPRGVARLGLALAVCSLAVLAGLRPSGFVLAVVLGVMGLGLGSFTPANNRSLMLAAPAGTSGAVAGLLNMTRGLGTAAGTAIAVVAFAAPGRPADGFTAALAALVVIGCGGLLTSGTRGNRHPGRGVPR